MYRCQDNAPCICCWGLLRGLFKSRLVSFVKSNLVLGSGRVVLVRFLVSNENMICHPAFVRLLKRSPNCHWSLGLGSPAPHERDRMSTRRMTGSSMSRASPGGRVFKKSAVSSQAYQAGTLWARENGCILLEEGAREGYVLCGSGLVTGYLSSRRILRF